MGLGRKFIYPLTDTSLSPPQLLKIWACLSELLENYSKNKQRNAMMNKGQKVEGGVFALYFSVNVGVLEFNILKTFCTKQYKVYNSGKYFSD